MEGWRLGDLRLLELLLDFVIPNAVDRAKQGSRNNTSETITIDSIFVLAVMGEVEARIEGSGSVTIGLPSDHPLQRSKTVYLTHRAAIVHL